MILFVIAIIILVSLAAMAVVIKDLAGEFQGMEEETKSKREKDDAKIRAEMEKWRDGK
jgi:hypothetical protein